MTFLGLSSKLKSGQSWVKPVGDDESEYPTIFDTDTEPFFTKLSKSG